MFSTFHDELQYIFLEKNFIFMDFFWLLKMPELTSFESFLLLETKEISFALPQMTSVPTSLTAKKTMKMTFFSKKIYCNSS